MKIGIDISQIVYGTGVSVYTKNLVENLVKIDKENEYILFGGSLRRLDPIKSFIGSLPGHVLGKTYPLSPKMADILWNRLHILYIERLTGQLDVFHSSDWTQPPSHAFNVTTIHDLAPFVYPKLTPPEIVSAHKARLPALALPDPRQSADTEAPSVDLPLWPDNARSFHSASSLGPLPPSRKLSQTRHSE